MERHFEFLDMNFFTRASVFPGSLGTFRYRFQRTGWLNKPDSTIQVWVYENTSFELAQEVETETGQKVLHGIATVWAPYLSETGGFILVDPRYPENDHRHSGHEWQTRALGHPFERNLPMIHTDMLPVVVNALESATGAQELLRGLPGTLN